MKKRSIPYFFWEIFRAISPIQEKLIPAGKYFKKEMKENLKEISKEEIEKLIKVGILKNTGEGYINPKKKYRVGYYRTKGAAKRRYIEDWYADMAKKIM